VTERRVKTNRSRLKAGRTFLQKRLALVAKMPFHIREKIQFTANAYGGIKCELRGCENERQGKCWMQLRSC
jgi:hypothetical protein